MDWRGCSHCVDIRTGGAVVTVWTYGQTVGAVDTVWTYGLEGL